RALDAAPALRRSERAQDHASDLRRAPRSTRPRRDRLPEGARTRGGARAPEGARGSLRDRGGDAARAARDGTHPCRRAGRGARSAGAGRPQAVPSAVADDAVVVRIETTPSGARVLVQGEERGMSPTELHLDRSAGPVAIELQRAGFLTLTQTVLPDADQRLL